MTMILRSYTLKIVSVAVLASFGIEAKKATAANFEFSAVYDTVVTIDPTFRPDLNISRVTVTGVNPNAPFGLTNFSSNTFGQLSSINPLPDGTIESAVFNFNADPTVFGLPEEVRELPFSDTYSGENTDNAIFGNADDMAEFNFIEATVRGSGNITVIGGEGIFENATGSIAFSQQDELTGDIDPRDPFASLTEPFEGQATLTFSINTNSANTAVPEPNANITLIGMGIIVGCVLKLRNGNNRRIQ